jgi:hypothetical protein
MDAKHKDIKERAIKAYEIIKAAEKELEECRSDCEHPSTELCIYSTGPGRYYEDTEICTICGDVIRFKENPQQTIWTSTGRVTEGDLPHISDISEDDFNEINSWKNEGFYHDGIKP